MKLFALVFFLMASACGGEEIGDPAFVDGFGESFEDETETTSLAAGGALSHEYVGDYSLQNKFTGNCATVGGGGLRMLPCGSGEEELEVYQMGDRSYAVCRLGSRREYLKVQEVRIGDPKHPGTVIYRTGIEADCLGREGNNELSFQVMEFDGVIDWSPLGIPRERLRNLGGQWLYRPANQSIYLRDSGRVWLNKAGTNHLKFHNPTNDETARYSWTIRQTRAP